MSSKKVTTRATRTAAPSRPGSGQEGGLAQEATATSTPSPTPPAVEAFTPEETALNSTESTDNMGTQPLLQCDVATASMEEMQAEIHCLEQLE
jgi:hypothetical protein